MVLATSRVNTCSEMGSLTPLHDDLVLHLLLCALHAFQVFWGCCVIFLRMLGTSWMFLPGTSWILSFYIFEERFPAVRFSSREWLGRCLASKSPISAPKEASQRFERP